MSDITDVYLIAGFLGSGKTTLLNRIIDRFPEDKKLTILVNEFGEIGVDGTLIEGEDIDMMEISKGTNSAKSALTARLLKVKTST
ncbi:MAG: hypothetical protein JRI64_10750 [Deltaproteobacteria bacterium]|nr:hypothetical protein [Deltaproteobacteria bacterium]